MLSTLADLLGFAALAALFWFLGPDDEDDDDGEDDDGGLGRETYPPP